MHERFRYKTKDDLIKKARSLGFELPYSDDISPILNPALIEGFSIPNRMVVQPMEGYILKRVVLRRPLQKDVTYVMPVEEVE